MLESKKDVKAWLYLLPAIIAILIFIIYPIFNSIIVSFNYDYEPLREGFDKFGNIWGIQNYKELFDPYRGFLFRKAFVNTLIIVFISVPLTTVVALLIAVILNSIKPFQRFFQIIFFTPYVTNTIAIGMVFSMVFGTFDAGGMINGIFGSKINFIGGASSYFMKHLVLQIYLLWNGLAFKILIFIGGLQNIGKQYYDAAKIDGTDSRRIFRKITLPLLSPTVMYITITSMIGAFKTYSAVVGLYSDPSAVQEMMTVVGFIYENISSNYGLAAAASVVLFVFIMIFTGVQYLITNRRVHY